MQHNRSKKLHCHLIQLHNTLCLLREKREEIRAGFTLSQKLIATFRKLTSLQLFEEKNKNARMTKYQYKYRHSCSCKNYRGKGMEGGKKASLRSGSLADQKITILWKKCVLGHPVARATSYCLLPGTF